MDNGYIVRFIRKDDKPVEEFFYHTYEEAFVHLALFRIMYNKLRKLKIA